jgi:hypothetical protein
MTTPRFQTRGFVPMSKIEATVEELITECENAVKLMDEEPVQTVLHGIPIHFGRSETGNLAYHFGPRRVSRNEMKRLMVRQMSNNT